MNTWLCIVMNKHILIENGIMITYTEHVIALVVYLTQAEPLQLSSLLSVMLLRRYRLKHSLRNPGYKAGL